MLGAVVLFGAAWVVFMHYGLSNDRGLIINGIITLARPTLTRHYDWLGEDNGRGAHARIHPAAA